MVIDRTDGQTGITLCTFPTFFHSNETRTTLIFQVTCSSPESPQIEISKSDDYDKFLDQLRFTSAQNQPGPGVF